MKTADANSRHRAHLAEALRCAPSCQTDPQLATSSRYRPPLPLNRREVTGPGLLSTHRSTSIQRRSLQCMNLHVPKTSAKGGTPSGSPESCSSETRVSHFSRAYWTLKQYTHLCTRRSAWRHRTIMNSFLLELDDVWISPAFDALTCPLTGRLVTCRMGDVCLSRRKNAGEHTVVPLHASIQEHLAGALGYVNLAPMHCRHKIANAETYEVSNGATKQFMRRSRTSRMPGLLKNVHRVDNSCLERKTSCVASTGQPSVEQRVLSVHL